MCITVNILYEALLVEEYIKQKQSVSKVPLSVGIMATLSSAHNRAAFA
jgi:hypothetical protein